MRSGNFVEVDGVKYEIERSFDGSAGIFQVDSITGMHISESLAQVREIYTPPNPHVSFAIIVKKALPESGDNQ